MDGRAGRGGDLPGQLARFLLVGVLSAGVDLAVYGLALHLGAWVVAARTLSFVCGTATAYALNRRWAFRVRSSTRRALGFGALYGSTFLVILAANAAALAVLPAAWWTVTGAWAVSQALGTTVNFVLLRTVVFAP